MKNQVRLFVVDGCMSCPNRKSERTPGSGYAQDYWCTPMNKKIAGYIEWPSEAPKPGDFPSWCPLEARKAAIVGRPTKPARSSCPACQRITGFIWRCNRWSRAAHGGGSRACSGSHGAA